MNLRTTYNLVKSIPSLTRWGVSLAVSFSAITGYIVFKGIIDWQLFVTTLGVILLAGGASALNQYQERNTDALMRRTKNRPIPSNTISSITGLYFSLLLCLFGLILLFLKSGIIPATLGFFNIIWYNGLYTYLKRKTAFAVVPGSLTGVTPILIGWTAAGGNILNPVALFIAFFIYMWQIPHFWLLLIKYNNDYQKAGLGSLYKSFSENQIKRILFIWILATSLASLLLPYYGIIQSKLFIIILIIANIGLVITFQKIIFNRSNQIRFKLASIEINVFMISIMTILILDKLL